MADAAEEIAKLGVDMFNVACELGIKKLWKLLCRDCQTIENRPLVLAVTALTSFDNDTFKYVYNGKYR